MVEKEKEKHGWEFVFLGANMDAIKVAGRFGIGADRAFDYNCDSEGTRLNFQVFSETVSAIRQAPSPMAASAKMSACFAPLRRRDKKEKREK